MSIPKPDCTFCGGTGLSPAPPDPPHPPSYNRCECALRGDILANVERGLVGLSSAAVIGKSPLLGKHKTNLWITTGSTFLSHLRHVAVRQTSTWNFKVVSDAELVTAWLATAGLGGGEIIDPDAYTVSTKYMTVPDLVTPPDMVVIRMGVKVARNSAAPEVLAEALNTRFHEGKPTWIWDEPSNPLDVGHLFWSDTVARVLTGWERIGGAATMVADPAQKPRGSQTSGKRTLR